MIRLNLISQGAKNEIKFRRFAQIFRKICASLIGLTMTIALILLLGKLFLSRYSADITGQYSLVTKNYEDSDTGVKGLDQRLTSIQKIQDDYYTYSDLMEKLTGAANNGIKFSEIRIDAVGKKMSFGGTADTRDSLLTLKKNLEETETFSDVDLPLSNILQKDNVEFEISANLNL